MSDRGSESKSRCESVDQREITVQRRRDKSNPRSEGQRQISVESLRDKSNARYEIYTVYRIIEQYRCEIEDQGSVSVKFRFRD